MCKKLSWVLWFSESVLAQSIHTHHWAASIVQIRIICIGLPRTFNHSAASHLPLSPPPPLLSHTTPHTYQRPMHTYVCGLFILSCVGTKTKDSILKYSSSASAIQSVVHFLSASPLEDKCFPRATLRQENHLHAPSHTRSFSPCSCPSLPFFSLAQHLSPGCVIDVVTAEPLQSSITDKLSRDSVCVCKCEFLCVTVCVWDAGVGQGGS